MSKYQIETTCPNCGSLPGQGKSCRLVNWFEGGWNVMCTDCGIEFIHTKNAIDIIDDNIISDDLPF